MTILVEESGVIFGPFDEDSIFQVEQSPAIEALGEHLKKVEFIISTAAPRDKKKIVFVEAKSSIPRKSDEFFSEIRDKMLHSLSWWGMTLAGKHPDISNELPESLRERETVLSQIDLILVIPPIPDEHLSEATDKFRAVMQGDARAWGIEIHNVKILNHSRAQRYGIIQPE